jgi:3-oxoacyl-[acyl-carrier protein] reductase
LDTELKGRGVLVTGGAGGIGTALTRAFHEEGAKVAVHYHSNAKGAEALAREVGGASVRADLTVEADVDRALEATLARFGRLDAAILNAAVGLVGPIERFSPRDWRRTLDVNLTAPFLVARAAIPHLRPTRGALIAIGSEFSRAAMPWLGAYAASKWGLLGLMRTLALELRPDGIRVSTVLPGGILTDFGPDTAVQKRERQARGERFLHPDDVAHAILFLLTQPDTAWTEELVLWPR